MKLKEFFRPTKFKVIFTLVLLLIMPVFLNTGIVCSFCPAGIESCPPCPYLDYKPLILDIGLVLFNLSSLIFYLVPLLSISFVFSYILSCLIIFLYDKINERDRKSTK